MRLKVSNVCQLLDKSKFPATHTQLGCTFINNGDGSFTINGTIQNGGSWSNPLQQITQNLYGHKILLLTNSTSDIVRGEMKFTLQNGSSRWGTYNSIYTVIYDDYEYIAIRIYMDDVDAGKTIDNATVKFQLFDLTEMYGAGNEPTTVAQFRQDFPNEMYEYSPECWKKFRRLKYVTETKNLFDINSAVKVSGASSFSKNGNQITVSTNGTYHYISANVLLDTSLVGKTVTFSAYAKTSDKNTAYLRIQWLDPNGLASKNLIESNTTSGQAYQKVSLTGVVPVQPDDEHNMLCLSFYSDGPNTTTLPPQLYTVIYTDIQLELGSTASPYQPYGYLPLNRGKYIANKEPVQLLDKSKYPATLTDGGVTFTNNGDGTITANGTSTKNYAHYPIIVPRPAIGHKILVLPENNGKTQDHIYVWASSSNSGSSWVDDLGYGGNIITITGIGITLKKPYTWIGISLDVNKGWVMNNHIYKPQLFDLTAMYGAGNEPTTVAQFRADFPNELYDYNPYNAITFR